VSENMVEKVSLSGHNASFSISLPKRRVWWNILCTEWFCVHGKTKSDKTQIFFFHMLTLKERWLFLMNCVNYIFFLYFHDHFTGYNIFLFIHFKTTYLLNVFMCSNNV
jgi:hypothetical protein